MLRSAAGQCPVPLPNRRISRPSRASVRMGAAKQQAKGKGPGKQQEVEVGHLHPRGAKARMAPMQPHLRRTSEAPLRMAFASFRMLGHTSLHSRRRPQEYVEDAVPVTIEPFSIDKCEGKAWPIGRNGCMGWPGRGGGTGAVGPVQRQKRRTRGQQGREAMGGGMGRLITRVSSVGDGCVLLHTPPKAVHLYGQIAASHAWATLSVHCGWKLLTDPAPWGPFLAHAHVQA